MRNIRTSPVNVLLSFPTCVNYIGISYFPTLVTPRLFPHRLCCRSYVYDYVVSLLTHHNVVQLGAAACRCRRGGKAAGFFYTRPGAVVLPG